MTEQLDSPTMQHKTGANDLMEAGNQGIHEGVEKIAAARNVADGSREALAEGARDVTRGADAMRAAQITAALSLVVAEAGANDISQGATLLAASDDLAVQSALVSKLSEEDLGIGMDLAAIAGQLWTASDVVAALDMPVLAGFLEVKGENLQRIAVEILLRFGATSVLADYIQQTGAAVGGLGIEELDEGISRLNIADKMDVASEKLVEKSDELTAQGLVSIAVSSGMKDVAQNLVVDGASQIAAGAQDIGKAEEMNSAAAALEDPSGQ
jgi:hypothetical protein